MTRTLIATDLDDTILLSDKTISQRTQRALEAALSEGHFVVPITGRPTLIAQQVIDELALDTHWVFANGAIISNVGANGILKARWFDNEPLVQMVSDLREAGPFSVAIELEDAMIYEAGLADLVLRPHHEPVPDALASFSLMASGTRNVQKVLVFDTSRPLERVRETVATVAGDRAEVTTSGPQFVELAPPGVTKGSALRWLAEYLSVDQEHVVAFGDNKNDLSMLEWAGRSYAVSNAVAEVKEVVDAVIPSNEEDGVAGWIEANLLGA